MKVLVTGGGGFVGRHLIDRLLARGYAIRSFGRAAQPELEALGVECHRGDLADAEAVASACAGMEAVFHVAAKAGIWGSWESFYSPNVLGARNVVAACRKHGIGRLVYTSTPSVVFNRQPFSGADESLPYGSRWLCHCIQQGDCKGDPQPTAPVEWRLRPLFGRAIPTSSPRR